MREPTFTMSDQMIWNTYYSHLATQGVMTNRQVDEWYAALEATKEERRTRPAEPPARKRGGRPGQPTLSERLAAYPGKEGAEWIMRGVSSTNSGRDV